ncbi:methyltransferase family protein [Pseudoxanthomonas indica]|uniref:Protein-S-isoprenylcysteine O-methyltransferase Ste14 n=1 Tax=Pseudoxanthomonas indica TaxID=428993 RepID=A0A1T5J6U9_9GAMM|nr:isoprenylcysteine carboxylmethyltransferase family protein [Pseudoxanthomonas indica]GGD56740.1 hypothetical protein GCM10007235_31380 [Pseudoxanthomonas indica]SKC47076.1 Protein-S-isoprenylcysteine O-methyltransferase Ste14 [Pseudoxanthomonas indica]
MLPSPDQLLTWLHHLAWLTFAGYWLWQWRSVKQAARTEPAWHRLLAYWLPLLFAASLLGPGDWYIGCPLHERILPKSLLLRGVGVALTFAGVALAIQARRMLGRNWSSEVQIKQDHELIQRGPYRFVRHPIYTGLLLAFFGTALKMGDWRGWLALAVVFASFWYKSRQEERFLLARFGTPYADYMKKTKALVPGVL